MKKATLFKKLSGEKVECTACSWYCKISNNKTGICSVRQNINGNLYLTVYGKAASANIDPIEKKPLFHFLPGSEIFSFGTVGCNFSCDFCQNWDISQINKGRDAMHCVSTIGNDLPPEKIIETCLKYKIPAVAFTYNEPTVFMEYAMDTMRIAKEKGIKTVFVSNGFQSKEAVKMLAGNLDAINIDLKSFSNDFYQKVCHAKLKPVLENIERFYGVKIWIEITTLLIPGENDSDKELKQIAKFLAGISKDIPWHVTKFHPDFKMLDKEGTSSKSLKRAYEIGKETGLSYVYIGNISDEDHESTFCPRCLTLVIKRSWYNIKIENFKDGKCQKCGYKIPGIWE